MAFDPKKWTIKTQEAFGAAIDNAKARSNPELTPDHVMAAMMRHLMQDFAHKTGAMSEDEAVAWGEDLDRRAFEGRYLFSITHIIAVAEAI